MLEVRYHTVTKKVTAWCGDAKQFGNLDRGRDNETIVVLDTPIPDKPTEAWLYDEATQSLIPNPDYIEPEPPIVFEPPEGTGMPEKVEYIEQFLKRAFGR